jgi:hypothetical protein
MAKPLMAERVSFAKSWLVGALMGFSMPAARVPFQPC